MQQTSYRLGAVQFVTADGTSRQTTAFGTAEDRDISSITVRVYPTVAIHIAVGANPTAAQASSTRMAAGVPEYFDIKLGEKFAIIKQSGASDGSCDFTVCEGPTNR